MKIKIFDGGMGTMLQNLGLPTNICPEQWNIDEIEKVASVHREYINAGSDIITTNTFGGNRVKLSHYGLQDAVALINTKGVEAARLAAAPDTLIAGSVGSIGKFLQPLGEISFDEACAVFHEQISALVAAGVDMIIIETIIDIQEMRAALIAAKKAGSPKTICQLSYSEDGRTITGTDPATAAITLTAMGADAIGANCSLGPNQLIDIVKAMAAVTNLPLTVQANAGMPILVDGETKFPMAAQEFASWAPQLIAAGASYIGGCCGTTPTHISAVKNILKANNITDSSERRHHLPTVLTSRSRHVYIGHDFPTVLIGERINPSGRKALATEIKNGNFATVKREALAQAKAGAGVLDVNMGVPDIDQAAAMKKSVLELSSLVDLPFAIDTTDETALEEGLKNFPGRALINSVSAEEERIAKFLPLAKKYGAAILCLPITKAGIPETAEDRLRIVRQIIHAAFAEGLKPQDIMLDPLVLTVAADAKASQETLRTLALYREKLGYPTAMGLSNVSFGLPARPDINAAFYALAVQAGLSAPILNPYDKDMQKAFLTCNVLKGYDAHAKNYINFVQEQTDTATDSNSNNNNLTSQLPILERIKHAVVSGEKDAVADLIAQALTDGHAPLTITENALSQAMSVVGTLFSTGKCFLPQVMLSAETMKVAFDKLKALLPRDSFTSKGTVLIATVQGDIHDLGKNIVSALLENNGFTVIDLGKDVSRETILQAALENKPDVIGLSALMTTTLPQVDKVISLLKEKNIKAKIIVGGAVLTEEYAAKAGADAFAKDAIAGLDIIKGWQNH